VNPIFTINFRREAYLREMARVRRRIIALGVWVGYFGVLALVIGLYGLTCASLTRRTGILERQVARLGAETGDGGEKIPATELANVERVVANPRAWRDRLARLATLLPSNAELTSVAVNPDNQPDPLDQKKLVLTGMIRNAPGQDRMSGLMALVSALHADTAFAAGYGTIKLTNSRVSPGAGTMAEFVIECR